MSLNFRYNDTTYEALETTATTNGSAWANCSPLKLYSGIDPYQGIRYYTPLYKTQSEYALAYTDGSTIKQYVNTTAPTINVYFNNEKYFAAKRYSDNQVVKSSLYISITYNANGGTLTGAQTTSAWTDIGKSSKDLQVNSSAIKSYHIQIAWNTKADGTGGSYTNGQTYPFSSTNTELYAIYKRKYTLYSATAVSSGTMSSDSGYRTYITTLTFTFSLKEVGINDNSYSNFILDWGIPNSNGLAYTVDTVVTTITSTTKVYMLYIHGQGGNSNAGQLLVTGNLLDPNNGNVVIGSFRFYTSSTWYTSTSSGGSSSGGGSGGGRE